MVIVTIGLGRRWNWDRAMKNRVAGGRGRVWAFQSETVACIRVRQRAEEVAQKKKASD